MAGTRQDQEKSETDTKLKDSMVVTLMVTPKDAERIALAQSEGQIVLSPRNPLDTELTATTGVPMRCSGNLTRHPLPLQHRSLSLVARSLRCRRSRRSHHRRRIATVEAIRAAKRTDVR